MNLDWKWIGLGVLIMLVLNFIGGAILAALFSSQLSGISDPAEIELSRGQMGLLGLLNFLTFAIGGFIVGIRSAGKTIVEPAIAAAVAVAIVLLLSGNLSVANVLAAGLVPFLAGLLGGWLGERRQDAKSAV